MIKCDKNEVKLYGHKYMILSELAVIVNSIEENLMKIGCSQDEARRDIDRAIYVARMSDKELHDKTREMVGDKISEIIDEIVNKMLEDEVEE